MNKSRTEILLCLIKEITKYCSGSGNKLGKKLLQKVIYLLQRRGINLGYSFSIHYYGPYSSQLEFDVYRLEIQGLIKINSNGYTHEIVPENGIQEEQHSVENLEGLKEETIENLIERLCSFSAYELELIATVDYIINQLKMSKMNKLSKQEIIEKVKKLKGSKYTDQKITEAIGFLEKYDFVRL